MAQNKILPWAQTGTANVLSDADYASDVASGGLYGDGVKSGQASSKQANKTWRQATAPGSGLAQFIVDNLALDVTDADTPATFSSRIANAVLKLAQISPFNQYWATATGGYRKDAIVSDISGNFWVSTADQNTTVPGASGANWQSLFNGYATQDWVNSGFVKQGRYNSTLSTVGYTSIGLRTGVTAGAPRIGAIIDSTDFGNFAMAGNNTLGFGNWTEQYYTLPSNGSRTISLQFNAPLDGYIIVVGSANYSSQNTNQTNLTIIVNGTSLSADQVTGATSMTNHSCVKVSAGSVTVSSYCGTSATNPPNVGHTLSYLYIPA